MLLKPWGYHVGVLRPPQVLERAAIEDFAASIQDVRFDLAVVVRGGPGQAFCGSLESVPDGEPLHAVISMMGRVLGRLLAVERPTVALVDGPAVGFGVGLATCCDRVLATTRSTLAPVEPRLGACPDAVVPILARRGGFSRPALWATRTTGIAGSAAAREGMVDACVDPAGAEDALREELHRLVVARSLVAGTSDVERGRRFAAAARGIMERGRNAGRLGRKT